MEYTHGIKTLLADSAAVTALVGTKIYPIEAPSGTTLPFVTYEPTGTTIYHTKERAEYQQARVEIVGYASTYADAVYLGSKIRAALSRKSIQASTPYKYIIDNIYLQDDEIERL